MPLWTQIDDLMPMHPAPQAVPHVWRWATLYPLAAAGRRPGAGGRGGERRAIAPGQPRPGRHAPTPRPTLWAAIQYLGPRETAPEHRHSQNAFRFVVEGEGVWTVVNGDPVRDEPRRLPADPGLELPRPPQRDRPADGLDRRPRHPVRALHRRRVLRVRLRAASPTRPPRTSRAPSGSGPPGPASAVRPADTSQLADRAPTAGSTPTARCASSSLLEDEGHAGHRRAGPRRGPLHQPDHRRRRDADHPRRVPPAARRAPHTEPAARSARRVFQVFEGTGPSSRSATSTTPSAKGDLFVVPSWVPWSLRGRDRSSTCSVLRRPDHRAPALRPHLTSEGADHDETRHPPHSTARTAAVRVDGDTATVIDGYRRRRRTARGAPTGQRCARAGDRRTVTRSTAPTTRPWSPPRARSSASA